MRRSIRNFQLMALVAVCFCAFVPPVVAQECPESLGSFGLDESNIWAVAASGGYAYVTTGEGDFATVDVSDPEEPLVLGSCGTQVEGQDIAVSGSHAFVAAGSGLSIIDVSDPWLPQPLASFFTPSAGADVAVSGDFAYLVAGESGLFIIDVSDPSSPSLSATYSTSPDAARAVAVSGHYGYLVDQQSLRVLDVSDPTRPEQVGFVYLPLQVTDIAVSGNYAAVVSTVRYNLFHRRIRLTVIDVADPHQPQVAGFNEIGPAEGHHVAVSSHFAYVPWKYYGGGGLAVLDFGEPSSPQLVGNGFGYAGTVSASGGYVYLATSWVSIFRDCASVFLDSFESGDTSAWSATVSEFAGSKEENR